MDVQWTSKGVRPVARIRTLSPWFADNVLGCTGFPRALLKRDGSDTVRRLDEAVWGKARRGRARPLRAGR
jgi:hypothetical protein